MFYVPPNKSIFRFRPTSIFRTGRKTETLCRTSPLSLPSFSLPSFRFPPVFYFSAFYPFLSPMHQSIGLFHYIFRFNSTIKKSHLPFDKYDFSFGGLVRVKHTPRKPIIFTVILFGVVLAIIPTKEKERAKPSLFLWWGQQDLNL